MRPTLFDSDRLHARELEAGEIPRLQVLFDDNPGYWLRINGQPPHAELAQQEFDELPPPHIGFSRRWFCGLFDRADALQGVAIVVANLLAPGVWHVALFLVADALHGSGAAGAIFHALEDWVGAQGAQWLRLGVVKGNARAEAFWQRQGFVEVRQRSGVDTGGRLNDVRVLVKPLAASALAEGLAGYWQRAPRDHPDSTLP